MRLGNKYKEKLKKYMPHPDNIVKSSVSQPVFTCSKLTIETLEQAVKYASEAMYQKAKATYQNFQDL